MLLITRQQWGAAYKDGFKVAPKPDQWWLHHSAGKFLSKDFNAEVKQVRALEQVGQTRFGGGISYTFLVAPITGNVYIGHSMNREGAHTFQLNSRSRGICLIGNFEEQDLTDAAMNSVAEIMVTEYKAGRAKTYLLNGGHRDTGFSSTACPGRNAWLKIGEINRRAERLVRGQALPIETGVIVIPISLPRTDSPANWDDPKSKWPQIEEIINLGYIKGWHGRLVLRLSCGHPGGYLHRAHVDYPQKPSSRVISWIDPNANQSHDLLPAYKQDVAYAFEPPEGQGTLMITYAAPGGASLNLEWEK